mgnify:CR=1 FL=1
MVRTDQPLIERMTLVWHDWFATSKASVPQKLMLRQNALLRRHALGNGGVRLAPHIMAKGLEDMAKGLSALTGADLLRYGARALGLDRVEVHDGDAVESGPAIYQRLEASAV